MKMNPGITLFVGLHGPQHFTFIAPYPELGKFLESMAKRLHRKLVEEKNELPVVFVTGHGNVQMAVGAM